MVAAAPALIVAAAPAVMSTAAPAFIMIPTPAAKSCARPAFICTAIGVLKLIPIVPMPLSWPALAFMSMSISDAVRLIPFVSAVRSIDFIALPSILPVALSILMPLFE